MLSGIDHCATYLDFFPPAVSKVPPANRLCLRVSKTYTSLFVPEPKEVQLIPSHDAMWSAEVIPATVNTPPAYNLLYPDTKAYTGALVPASSVSHTLPFH